MNSVYLRYWLPPFLWAALIFCVSSIPTVPEGPKVGGHHFPWDKFAHAAVYAVLAGLLFRAFTHAQGFTTRRAALLSIGFGALYALSDETHQFFVGRDAECGDLLADWSGALVTTFVLVLHQRRRERAANHASVS